MGTQSGQIDCSESGKALVDTVNTLRKIKDSGIVHDRETSPDGTNIILTEDETDIDKWNRHFDSYSLEHEKEMDSYRRSYRETKEQNNAE